MASGLAKLQLLIDLKNNLKAGLDGAKKQVEKSTGQIQGKLDAFKMKNIEAFSAVKDEIPGLGRAVELLTNPYVLAAAAVVGLGMAFYSAIDGATKFEHKFMNIRQLNLDKSRQELDRYRSEINRTALVTGVNNDMMAEGYYNLQSALGVYGSDATKIATLVGNYSIATQADFGDSINSTTKAMKAFGLGTSDVQALLESNAKTVQTGIVNFAQLAEVQTEYAGAASATGQSVDTANKMFAAFTSIAKNADTAANLTKTAFQGLADPKVLGQLEKYGVAVYDSSGKMRQFDDIIKQTSGKIDTMSDKKFNNFMGDVGGPEGLVSLFGKLRTGSEDFFKTMDTYDNTKFNLNDALANAKQDPETLKKIIGNQWDTIMDTIGLKFLPLVAKVLQPVSDFLTEIFGYLDGSTKISQEWVPYVELVQQYFGYIKTILSTIWTVLSGIVSGIISFMKNSVLLQDIAWAIGKAFWLVGEAIKALGANIMVIWDEVVMPIINAIEKAYVWIKELLSGTKVIDVKTRVVKSQADATHWANGSLKDPNKFWANGTPKSPLGETKKRDNTTDTSTEDAKKISGGSQTKNITVNIDSFIKGFSPQHQSINGMNKDELERWMTEMFLRVVRSTELSL